MSQHSQRTQRGPSVAAISIAWAAALAALTATYWIVGSGRTFDGRHLAGVLLGFLLFLSLAGQAAVMTMDRQYAQERMKRRAEQRQAREQFEAARPVSAPPVPEYRPGGPVERKAWRWSTRENEMVAPQFLSEAEREVWNNTRHEATAIIARVSA